MSKLSIFFFFFVFLCMISAAEYFINPLQIYETNTQAELKNEEISPLASLPSLPAASFSSALQAAKIANVSEEKPVEVNHIFHQAEFSLFSNQFRISKTSLVLKENEKTEEFASIYEIFSTKKRTISGAYEEVQKVLEKSLEGNVEGKIVEMEAPLVLGHKSFILNVAPDQKTVYLVVAYRDRLLGFEYPKLRHEEMKRLFFDLFSH